MLRALVLALGIALCLTMPARAQGQVGPSNYIICNKAATFSGVAAVTAVVPAVTGQTVYLCGWHITNSSATSATFTITTGTQTTNPCDTGTVTITPALSVTNTAPSTDHIDFADVSGKVSQALCVNPSANTISGVIWYAQY